MYDGKSEGRANMSWNISRFINEMLQEYICDKEGLETSEYVFNLYHIEDDENGGIKLEMKAFSGEMFVNKRTLSCKFQMGQIVKNHKKYIMKVRRELYTNLCNSLKDSTTTKMFNSNEALSRSLISNQVPGNENLS